MCLCGLKASPLFFLCGITLGSWPLCDPTVFMRKTTGGLYPLLLLLLPSTFSSPLVCLHSPTFHVLLPPCHLTFFLSPPFHFLLFSPLFSWSPLFVFPILISCLLHSSTVLLLVFLPSPPLLSSPLRLFSALLLSTNFSLLLCLLLTYSPVSYSFLSPLYFYFLLFPPPFSCPFYFPFSLLSLAQRA